MNGVNCFSKGVGKEEPIKQLTGRAVPFAKDGSWLEESLLISRERSKWLCTCVAAQAGFVTLFTGKIDSSPYTNI